ncbi:hypothetical protein [uncultured Haemophilus sp.]|uniref:hypothetical protein n=1 Tax=uncultured Haemophilus sp. TaxID=237779 RepID=UPI0025852BC9|nr:hypothetical protein [uncultured Haemophilus sp.]
MKPILYYAADCPDTAPFVAELKRLGVDYEAVEVLSSIPNLKQWLRLRDRHAAFDDAKAQGYAGFPAGAGLALHWPAQRPTPPPPAQQW